MTGRPDRADPRPEAPSGDHRAKVNPRSRWRWWLPPVEAGALGLGLGIVDCFLADSGSAVLHALLIAGVVEGVRHAGRAWSCWLPLGVGTYLAHLAAIALGRQPPFVESTYAGARQQILALSMAGPGLMIGVAVRVYLGWLGVGRRATGPPVRVLPRTARGLIGAVAWVALCVGVLRWLMLGGLTVYADGFTAARFDRVRVGQARAEVAALLGTPLRVIDYDPADTSVIWAYSAGAGDTANYWRYWIIFDADQVQSVVRDFWFD